MGALQAGARNSRADPRRPPVAGSSRRRSYRVNTAAPGCVARATCNLKALERMEEQATEQRTGGSREGDEGQWPTSGGDCLFSETSRRTSGGRRDVSTATGRVRRHEGSASGPRPRLDGSTGADAQSAADGAVPRIPAGRQALLECVPAHHHPVRAGVASWRDARVSRVSGCRLECRE